jgi:hypothetical protein
MYDRAELRSKLSGWNMNAMVDTLALFKLLASLLLVKSNMRATNCEGVKLHVNVIIRTPNKRNSENIKKDLIFKQQS